MSLVLVSIINRVYMLLNAASRDVYFYPFIDAVNGTGGRGSSSLTPNPVTAHSALPAAPQVALLFLIEDYSTN